MQAAVKTVAVITGAGKDSVGFVASVTELLYNEGVNLLDSSMTLLRGEFALILMVELPLGLAVADLKTKLNALEGNLNMQLQVRQLTEEELKEPGAQNQFMISIYGADKPGIVAASTRALANKNLNITDVQTKLTGPPSAPIFIMLLEVTAPESVTLSDVQKLLEPISSGLGVAVSVQELDVLEL
jgi:glycine cleavage system transcriptional repressor